MGNNRTDGFNELSVVIHGLGNYPYYYFLWCLTLMVFLVLRLEVFDFGCHMLIVSSGYLPANLLQYPARLFAMCHIVNVGGFGM